MYLLENCEKLRKHSSLTDLVIRAQIERQH